MSLAPETGLLLEHLFRQQAGRIVSHLTRVVGPSRIDLAEETVQEAMLRALETWPAHGTPDNPAAWLFRVARNIAIDAIRRDRSLEDKRDTVLAELNRTIEDHFNDPDFEEQLRDDELRMIFMCCHPDIPRDSSVALSLKTIGGFSVREIARAFLTDDTTIAQRLVRAKRKIRDSGLVLEIPRAAELEPRLDSVLNVLYFLFNEGYSAHEGEDLIRIDMCAEALRLACLIAASSLAMPRVHALVAVMAFQSARLPARTDESGDLILLDDQDRTRWDERLIALGFHHLDRSISGGEVSEYHLQAAIAAAHARGNVDWSAILHLYDRLLEINASPIVALNRAVAIAKVHGPAAALAAIRPLTNHPKLESHYLFLAVRGHLLLALDRKSEAAACFLAASECRCSEPERRFLLGKMANCWT